LTNGLEIEYNTLVDRQEISTLSELFRDLLFDNVGSEIYAITCCFDLSLNLQQLIMAALPPI
jgi:hypothetical protein